jgi:hypothetical protein
MPVENQSAAQEVGTGKSMRQFAYPEGATALSEAIIKRNFKSVNNA